MLVYINKVDHSKTRLTNEHLLLLRMIYQLGYVNRNQLNLLWSIVKRKTVEYSQNGLVKFKRKGGLLTENKYQAKDKQNSSKKLARSVFTCSTAAVNLLMDARYLSADAQPTMRAINLHNELTIQSFIGGLWCAAFIGPNMSDQQIAWLYSQPKLSPFSSRLSRTQEPPVQVPPQYQSSFEPAKYDFSSFVSQQGVNRQLATKLPFIADLMCSWQQSVTSGPAIKHESYIEFDNLTERAVVTLNKLYNYIIYASDHPDTVITLHIVCRDRSIFGNLYKRENAHDTLRHERYVLNVMEHYTQYDADEERDVFILEYYDGVPNLKIYISGIEDSYLDIRNHLIMKNVTADTKAVVLDWLKQRDDKVLNKAQYHDTRLYKDAGVIQLNSDYNSLILGEYNAIDTIESLRFMSEDAQKGKSLWPCVFYQKGIGNRPLIPVFTPSFKAYGGLYRPTQPIVVVHELNGVLKYQTAEPKPQPLLL
ncbi:hypothetical protein [Lactiplantibacillus plantarum]|uniref:hypothetical protein n=1 Tax=Lactiplantibacillus plantarum TaxID=1590 RepID=UPI001BA9A3E0|nr:hypothetical protein [Lactiplantibacillus plantarum]MBS0954977.1 hypothetical protein [Lactiplantibacillus plantarum]